MSQRDSEYERVPHEHYETPEWATDAVIGHLAIRKGSKILEPAAGGGKMVRALKRHGYLVEASDIRRGNRDFLKRTKTAKIIVTNPPYNQAMQFIEHALALTEPEKGTVAMLLRVDFDSGSTRSHVFRDHPAFYKKVVLTRRIEWFKPPPREDGKKPAGPSENHAWYVWRWVNRAAPTIGYAP